LYTGIKRFWSGYVVLTGYNTYFMWGHAQGQMQF
jgi:hypothetical protein